jgi:hypothetical protein
MPPEPSTSNSRSWMPTPERLAFDQVERCLDVLD